MGKLLGWESLVGKIGIHWMQYTGTLNYHLTFLGKKVTEKQFDKSELLYEFFKNFDYHVLFPKKLPLSHLICFAGNIYRCD